MRNTKLPPGWSTSPLSELIPPDGIFKDGDWVESKDQDPHGEVRLVQLADIGDGSFRDRSNRSLTSAKADELHCTPLHEGDILVARMPEPLGRACLYPGSSRPAVTVVDVCIIRTGKSGIDRRWLMWAINSPQVRQQIISFQTGTTRKRISRKNLEKIKIAIPPFPEQRRIAESLDRQLSRLDAAKSGLNLAKVKSVRFKESVYSRATEGVFSRKVLPKETVNFERLRRANSPTLARKSGKVETIEIPEYTLPKNWAMTSLGALSYESGYGTSAKCDYGASGYPVIRIPNIRDGSIDLTDIKRAVDPNLNLGNFSLDSGDLLFVRTNGSRHLIGRAGIVDEPLPYAFASYLIRFRLIQGIVEPKWIQLVTQSPKWRREIERHSASSAGQYNLSIKTLSKIPIPLPPLEVQRETLKAIEVAVSESIRISSAIDAARVRADYLQTSLLSRAFSGQLVPQDTSDEPAPVLLERIQADRETRGTKPKRSTRRSRKKTAVAPQSPLGDPTPIPAETVQEELPL
ncbi:restriction endonuclease subunit S [Nocardiopsis dassonvillei]|uniref:restriction endonuclease subunit S n=1 Tax=Nocardiopsis dassonvillei TaxID=2014 RepID=UPI0035577BED